MNTELTPKQAHVKQLADAGYGLRRMARILGVTRTTVQDHLDAIARKELAAIQAARTKTSTEEEQP